MHDSGKPINTMSNIVYCFHFRPTAVKDINFHVMHAVGHGTSVARYTFGDITLYARSPYMQDQRWLLQSIYTEKYKLGTWSNNIAASKLANTHPRNVICVLVYHGTIDRIYSASASLVGYRHAHNSTCTDTYRHTAIITSCLRCLMNSMLGFCVVS